MRGKNIILIIKKGRRGEEKEIEMEKRYSETQSKEIDEAGGGAGRWPRRVGNTHLVWNGLILESKAE